jgi:quinoprotein glucose dehydrogenase
MRPLRVLASIGVALPLVAAVLAQAPSPKPSAFAKATADRQVGDWPSYGGTNWSQKYSALDQVTRSNFNDLKVAWTWASPDLDLIRKIADNPEEPYTANGMKATPLVVKGVMYVSTGLGQIAAIEPATGTTRWLYNPEAYAQGAQADTVGWLTRGVAYWTDGKDDERILMGTLDGYLLALNARTGRPIATFGDSGKTDLTTTIPRARRGSLHQFDGERHYLSVDSPPVVVRDTVIVGSSMSDRPPVREWVPGDVQAFDVRTGKLKWTFHVIPRDGEFGVDTWQDGAHRYTGNANVWSMMSGDDELGMVYLPTTTPNSDYYGGHRKGDGLFAESIVAVNVETGQRVWHFQAVHHGVWDYDLPAAPTLLDITVDGRRIKALAQVSKQAFTYVFDRVTGRPVWPIEERAVPPSDIPGEQLSKTQPFPTRPPAFDQQGIADRDLIDFTPALRAEARAILSQYRYGPIFTPPSLYVEGGTRGTIFVPGINGGALWSGSGADPETGFLYVPSKTQPVMMTLTPLPGDRQAWPSASPIEGTPLPYVPNGKIGPPSVHPAKPAPPTGPQGLPLIKPPYSRLTAYNLNTGTIAWQVPTGAGQDGIRNHPALAGVNLPDLGGQGGLGGPLVTKTLVIYGLLSSSGRADRGGRLVAYDKATGALLGSVMLPGAPLGTPMTYAVNGKQFVALTLLGGQLVALALP